MEKITSFFCNSCHQNTLHDIIFRDEKKVVHDEDGVVFSYITNDVLKCRGCESVSFRYDEYFSEYGDSVLTVSYPPRLSRKKPEWVKRLDKTYDELLSEVYIALQNGCNRLALMGVRSIIDYFISSNISGYQYFAQGLDDLVSGGFITKKQKEILAIVVDAGNATIHRQFNPSDEILELIMDTVESLLHQEALAPSLQEVKRQIPSRKK